MSQGAKFKKAYISHIWLISRQCCCWSWFISRGHLIIKSVQSKLVTICRFCSRIHLIIIQMYTILAGASRWPWLDLLILEIRSIWFAFFYQQFKILNYLETWYKLTLVPTYQQIVSILPRDLVFTWKSVKCDISITIWSRNFIFCINMHQRLRREQF